MSMMASKLGFGYDLGYQRCPNLWGRDPAGYVVDACADLPLGARVLDLGCGEGKNAAYAATRGHHVVAVDGSSRALANANQLFAGVDGVEWRHSEASVFLRQDARQYELIICTGLLHCLPDEISAHTVIDLCSAHLHPSGIFVFSAFNSRRQELFGHEPGFCPLLLPHENLVAAIEMAGLTILKVTDSDLLDIHPHIAIEHIHSITRVVAFCA
jgi:2-polyprenyl-3-methyl-5-hydroxy-6-metoxy-1,4-benzoquinol methylase